MLTLCLTKGLNLLFLSVKCNGSMWDIYSVIIWYIHMVHYSDEVGLVLPWKILLSCAAQKTCAWGLEDSSWQKRRDMLRELMLSNSGYNKITLNHRMSPQLLPSIKTFSFFFLWITVCQITIIRNLGLRSNPQDWELLHANCIQHILWAHFHRYTICIISLVNWVLKQRGRHVQLNATFSGCSSFLVSPL